MMKYQKVIIKDERLADFKKADQITTKDYVQAHDEFKDATPAERPQAFLNYCFAIINQKNSGILSVREAAKAISSCGKNVGKEGDVKDVIKQAISLRRHPTFYKADHESGWDSLVKQIALLRKRF